jgi:cytochrome c biogenesis protein CcdA
MQMPLKFKQLSHKFVREGLARPAVIVGAATAGMLVTLLEAVCTGQMYVPVLAAVANTPALRPRALELLTIYNLGFVFPLLVILAMTYQGVTSESLAASAKRHLIPAKLALAALLGALGAYLLAAAVHPH